MTILLLKKNILLYITITGYYEELKSIIQDQLQLNM